MMQPFKSFCDASTVCVCVCDVQEELDSLRLQLEDRHQQERQQLRSSMTLAYKEDLLQARTELTDRYYKDIDQLNTKHAHDLEQLRAKLSDNHIKGEAPVTGHRGRCFFCLPFRVFCVHLSLSGVILPINCSEVHILNIS